MGCFPTYLAFDLETSGGLTLPQTVWHTPPMTIWFHELRCDVLPGGNQFWRARKP